MENTGKINEEKNDTGKNIEMSYEEALKKLEEIASKLEKGDLTLDESIEAFRKGMELSKYCAGKLDEAEKKISIFIENENGVISEEEFPPGSDSYGKK